jgi:hypothetical protein
MDKDYPFRQYLIMDIFFWAVSCEKSETLRKLFTMISHFSIELRLGWTVKTPSGPPYNLFQSGNKAAAKYQSSGAENFPCRSGCHVFLVSWQQPLASQPSMSKNEQLERVPPRVVLLSVPVVLIVLLVMHWQNLLLPHPLHAFTFPRGLMKNN